MVSYLIKLDDYKSYLIGTKTVGNTNLVQFFSDLIDIFFGVVTLNLGVVMVD